MRSEITTTDLTRVAYMIATAHEAPSAIDAANGMTIARANSPSTRLVVVVKNTGAEAKDVTVLASAPHLGTTPAVLSVPPGEVRIITHLDGQHYAASGRIDFDFEAGFTGEIAAFWLA